MVILLFALNNIKVRYIHNYNNMNTVPTFSIQYNSNTIPGTPTILIYLNQDFCTKVQNNQGWLIF